jgi:hypothetical protein
MSTPRFLVALLLGLTLTLATGASAGKAVSEPREPLLERALAAYTEARTQGQIRNPVLTVIDYALPSSERRLWVVEPGSKQVLFREFVAHGRGSTDSARPERAVRFGNGVGSLRTSLGAFLTGETYKGMHGYSLRLLGLEPGRNHRAFERAIVIHPAEYMSRAFRLRTGGWVGRSYGCPALDPAVSRRIIDRIRAGSLLYAGGPS